MASARERLNWPEKRRREPRLAVQNALLLVVHVEDVELPRPLGEAFAPGRQQATQDRRAKWVEQERYARPGRKLEGDGIAAEHMDRRPHPPRCPPQRRVPACNARQCGVKFDAYRGAKRELRGQQQGAAHSCAQVDKGVLVEGGLGLRAAPAGQDFPEN